MVIGESMALMWDTGMGIFPIMPIIKQLTSLPVIAVNSHSHFDHVGGNGEFGFVYGFEDAASLDRANKCWMPEADDENFAAEAFEEGFGCPEKYLKNGYGLSAIYDDTVFNLGNRIWRVMHTPGHSSDSIVLYCEKEKLVLTGDTVYPGTVYAQNNLPLYAKTIKLLAEKFKDYTLLCSHNEPLRSGEYILQIGEAFEAVFNKKTNPQPCGENLWLHSWKEISVLTSISG